jgi:glycosyltransferase involved in cell wall biosynthesis
MPIVAVACLLCGVPRFFLHRGSLSPDYWQFTDYQWHTHFRPMQFLYRYLAERPGFFFLNNSQVGCETDANWIGVPRDDRFRVLYNAVQFESLGENLGPNIELRRQAGIPDTAPVVGGSFRIVPVKRPRLWMETVRLVLAAIPDAHFLIIGGGEMTDEVIEYAKKHGFAARFHLPGRVADVGAWYRVMDVMLLTSEREGIPNAIIESQHFGVPVVATDVGGISEAIDEGKTGYAVRDATPENFAARLISILSDAAWREAARTAAPAFVHERFSLRHVLDQLQRYYGWD